MDHVAIDTGRQYSREEYRAWCAAQPRGRFERVDGRIVAMASERLKHLIVKGAVFIELRRAVLAAGVDCRALPDGATVEVGESDYEPDAVINYGPADLDRVIAPHPVVVVEVLSPGTVAVDTGAKLADYFRLSSVWHYLIVHPDKHVVVHHRRSGDAIATAIVGSGPIAMEPPGITVSVDAFYGD